MTLYWFFYVPSVKFCLWLLSVSRACQDYCISLTSPLTDDPVTWAFSPLVLWVFPDSCPYSDFLVRHCLPGPLSLNDTPCLKLFTLLCSGLGVLWLLYDSALLRPHYVCSVLLGDLRFLELGTFGIAFHGKLVSFLSHVAHDVILPSCLERLWGTLMYASQWHSSIRQQNA